MKPGRLEPTVMAEDSHDGFALPDTVGSSSPATHFTVTVIFSDFSAGSWGTWVMSPTTS